MTPTMVKAETLQLRDVVRCSSVLPYATATVVKIDLEHKMVHLIRPYIVCQDFSWTGGVLHSIGFEQYPVWFATDVELLERPNDTTPLK